MIPANTPDKIWARIEKTEGCWEWKGSRNRYGYGVISIARKMCSAHRLAWQETYGEIQLGLCVLHRCDNRACIRPEHLFLGTSPENTADMVAKGRQLKGMDNGHSSLTDQDVTEIRRLVAMGCPQRTVASRFHTTQANVGYISRRKTWRHIA